MPAYTSHHHDEPARLTGEWQATGRTRLRSAWFGLLVVELEQSAMVKRFSQYGGAYHWQEVKRWRRARRGHLITVGIGDILRAFARGKAERVND
jgi:hypothetical protein